jgi:Tfp pilus assembly protein PilN
MSDTPRDRGGPWATAARRPTSLSALTPLIAIAVTGITLITVIGLWASARLSLRSVEMDLADTEQESVALSVALDDYEHISQLSEWVTTVGADLQGATAHQVKWTRVLDGVASTMPVGVGLVRLDGRADTGSVAVTVQARTYTVLADWLARTSSTAGLTDLSLVSATRRAGPRSDTDLIEAVARGHVVMTSSEAISAADTRESSR